MFEMVFMNFTLGIQVCLFVNSKCACRAILSRSLPVWGRRVELSRAEDPTLTSPHLHHSHWMTNVVPV
jgi:hypothetical protein